MKKFSEFCEEQKPLEGEKAKLDELLGLELVVTGFKIVQSKFKESRCLHLEIELADVKHVIFTGSAVLMDQIEKYQKMIPFETKIIKNKRYYTFT